MPLLQLTIDILGTSLEMASSTNIFLTCFKKYSYIVYFN
jgi:hypothetical protein